LGFFGPVISRLPADAEAVALRDTMPGLASFPGFAEPNRSVRERPQLASFGVEPGQAGAGEDWNAGSRRAPEWRSAPQRPHRGQQEEIASSPSLIVAASTAFRASRQARLCLRRLQPC
jgi:hypothetical protein